jgi:arginine-tRNA-protein transferase
MDHDSREQYRHFLLQSNVTSNLVEFHADGRMIMVSIVDRLEDAVA